MRTIAVMLRFGLLVLAGLICLLPVVAQQRAKPYKVQIISEKVDAAADVTPADRKIRITYAPRDGYNRQENGFVLGAALDGKSISGDVSTLFMIDGKIVTLLTGQRRQKLPDLSAVPGGKKRSGSQIISELPGGVRITKTVEVVPGKRGQGDKPTPAVRHMDTLLVRCIVENRSNVSHKVAGRGVVESGEIAQPRLRYFSPLHKETLLGVTLAQQEVPPFLEALERNDLVDPGFKGIVTLKFGAKEMPSKIVLTRKGLVYYDQWDIKAEDGIYSACGMFWDERILPPQGRREFVFAYGAGLATINNDGLVAAQFSGSFDPGKIFTMTAYVDGWLDGQTLTLQLPKGIERVDGKATQIVPLEDDVTGRSLVMWRCRVQEVGTYPISIRSNNGVTQTWTVTVSAPD